MLDRNELGRTIVTTAKNCSDGYMRNINQFNTAHENETAQRCASAASNTAFFLLKALGYSDDEIKTLYAALAA